VTGTFTLREHTADVAVEATGDSPSAVFGAVADGLAAAMCDDVPESGGDEFVVERTAESLDGLLYDYLGRLIYERDVRGVLPVDNEATVTTPDVAADAGTGSVDEDAYRVDATARGVPLAEVSAREVKAVTYSDMVVEQREEEWYAYVVFDV
jgi:SHS2 domain-containing protein